MSASAGKIDVHHHVLPEFYKDVQRAAGIMGSAYTAFPEWSADKSLKLMDELGIASTIFSFTSPGIWFGDVAILDGDRRTHDVYAHGDTSILCVAKADFQKILSQHVEFYEAMLRLQARRIRQLFGLVEDLNTLPLRARLAKQLLHLVRSYGVPCLQHDGEIRIGLHLAQEELAQLLGASRQRVNQELKTMERELAIRIEAGGLVVRNRELLMSISDSDH